MGNIAENQGRKKTKLSVYLPDEVLWEMRRVAVLKRIPSDTLAMEAAVTAWIDPEMQEALKLYRTLVERGTLERVQESTRTTRVHTATKEQVHAAAQAIIEDRRATQKLGKGGQSPPKH